MPAATLLLLAAPLVPALHLPARALSRRALLSTTATAAAAAVLPPSVSWADAELAQVEGYGYAIAVPRSYYRPQGRPRTGLDDTIFSAADFATGRTASVSRTSAVDLLLDSGDPTVAQLPPPVELRELGKPAKVAALLARRRDGDPRGIGSSARSTVTSVTREGDELRFTLTSLTATATSATSSKPSARTVQARAIFVRPSAEASASGVPYLLTAWASSAAATRCEEQPCDCGEGADLRCACPPPVCAVESDAPADPTDLAIIDSLRNTAK